MILSTEGNVSLKPQGATGFAPIIEKVWFMAGDVLQIGQNSLAKVLCPEGVCQLGTGTYDTCCTSACSVIVTMMHRSTAGAPIKRAELSPADAQLLTDAERRIRGMNLGEVTTQFLITNLFSNWKLVETNQELDRLSTQLANPAAKQELKTLYLPMVRKTGDMHLKLNRLDDAKKIYSINITAASPATELNHKAVANEKAAAYTGLAEVEAKTGDNTKAIRHLEAAKDIQLKQGETQTAAETQKRITNLRGLQRVAPAKSP